MQHQQTDFTSNSKIAGESLKNAQRLKDIESEVTPIKKTRRKHGGVRRVGNDRLFKPSYSYTLVQINLNTCKKESIFGSFRFILKITKVQAVSEIINS